MLAAADSAHLSSIRNQSIATLRETIGTTTDVALLDVPNQRNVGDSLIWAGEIAYLAALGLRIRYAADLRTYDAQALRSAMPRGVVLLHGGGNFGDLWLGHQVHRERVVQELPDYRIVQLPQSLHFQDHQRAVTAYEILARHSDLQLLLRDTASMDKAKNYFPNLQAQFCPDMAFGWPPPSVGSPASGRDGVLTIARTDHEACSELAATGHDWLPGIAVRVTDWTEWNANLQTRAWWASLRKLTVADRHCVRAHREFGWPLQVGMPNRGRDWVLTRLNRVNIRMAVDLYRPARVIATDRLHAHVLAALLGKPHVVLDNTYHKVSTIFADYSGSFSTAHYATSLEEASVIATELLDR